LGLKVLNASYKYLDRDTARVIEVSDLRKSYGEIKALDGITFEVKEGEAFAFLGPNGAGKSTTIKILMGFIRPDSGDVRIFGRDVGREGKLIRKKIGYIPEDLGFYESLSVQDNLDFYARLFGIPTLERKERIREVLEIVDLLDRKGSKVRELSRGMKQRLAIAQSLINDPDLLIYDEPTSGLDPRSSYEIRELIKRLVKEGVTLFLSSHLLHDVEKVCEVAAIINKGRLIGKGRIEELSRGIRRDLIVKISCMNLTRKILDGIKGLDGVDLEEISGDTITLRARDNDSVAEVVSLMVRNGGKVFKVEHLTPDLEEVFLKLVGDGS